MRPKEKRDPNASCVSELGNPWWPAVKMAWLVVCLIVLNGRAFAAGELPKTLSELTNGYARLPAGENAALVYMQAFAALEVTPKALESTNLPWFGRSSVSSSGSVLQQQSLIAITDFMRVNQRAWDLFSQASRMKQCRYPVDYTQGYSSPLPHLRGAWRGVRFLALRAIWQAYNNRPGNAVDCLCAALLLTDSLRHDPVLGSQLVRAKIVSREIRYALEIVMNRVILGKSESDKLQALLNELCHEEMSGEAFKFGLSGERLMLRKFMDDPVATQAKLVLELIDTPGETTAESVTDHLLRTPCKLGLPALEQDFDRLLSAFDTSYAKRCVIFEGLPPSTPLEGAHIDKFGAWMLGLNSDQLKGEGMCLASLRVFWTTIAVARFAALHNCRVTIIFHQ